MSADKDAKAEPAARGSKPATTRTVVGVPALPDVPADRPSDLEMTRQLPPKDDGGDELALNTADITALSPADAERVLAHVPGVAGALPRPVANPGPPGKTLPPSREMFAGLRSGGASRPNALEKPTRPGIAPQTGISPTGRATLLLDASAPPGMPSHEGESTQERPAIVVPGTSAMPPKAVTQPPPWGAGAVKMTPGLRRGPDERIREPAPSAEEISSSLLLPDASGEATAANVEELSGSLLIEDGPDGKGPVVTKPPTPSGHPPPVRPSVKPPVPRSSSGPPAAHRALLGMPELPKTTPAPKLDFAPVHPSTPPPLPPSTSAPAAAPVAAPTPPPTAAAPPVSFPPGYVPPPDMPDDFVPPVMPDFPAPPDPAAPHAPQAIASAPLPQFPMPPDHTGALPANAAAAAYPHPALPLGAELPTAPMTGDIELTRLPRQGIQPALDKLRELLRRVPPALARLRPLLERARPLLAKVGPTFQRVRVTVSARIATVSENRPKWFWPAVVVAGLSVGIGLVALIVSAVRGAGEPRVSATATASGTGPSSTTTAGTTLTPATAALPPVPAPISTVACTVSGPPHVIGPSATVTAGVEVVRLGDDLAFGFAPSDHEAIAIRVDPASLSASATVKVHARDTVKRVTPIANARGGLSLVADVDRKGDRLQGRRTVLADPALQLGASAGHVAFARLGGGPAGELWALDDAAGIDAMRGAVEGGGDHAIALAFRHSGAVWMGVASASPSPAPRGDLSHIEGLGPAVGSPAIAVGAGVVMAAWSDRPSSDDPWRLRWTHFSEGSAPTTSETFHPPAGGKGEQTMSPALTALPGGRFLLVWTEGPTSGHDVRAVTLSADGKVLGAPLVISNQGINAGQAQVAVAASGQGAAAFLETGGNGFQIVATPIACGDGS